LAEVKSTGPEFDKKYKELVKLRVSYKKASDIYDKKLQQHNEALVHHEKAHAELHHMKLKLQEVSPLTGPVRLTDHSLRSVRVS
jgi:ribosomal protein S17